MTLKPAAPSDFPEIVSLTNLAFRGESGWTMETKYIEGQRIDLNMLEEMVAKQPEGLLLTWRDEAEGTLLGSVWLEPEQDGDWYMGLLAVQPEMQGRQLGRQMLDACEETVRAKGAERMVISVVNARSRLISWYERRGYVRTGERKPFPYDDPRVGKPLRDDLEFLVLVKNL